MGGASASIVIAHSISIISPHMPEFLHERTILVLPHFLKQVHLGDIQLIEDELKSQQCNFSLEKVRSV